MKKQLILIICAAAAVFGAYLKDIPTEIIQPDGTVLSVFATGDEFFNRLHDEKDYTIIQGSDGWFYYGVREGNNVVPSEFKAGVSDPESTGIQKGVKISEKLYRAKVDYFNSYKTRTDSKAAPTTGSINNLVIFIRFSDEAASIFNRERSYYDAYFNKPDASSLQDYFDEVSYNQLAITSSYYPHVDDFATNLSYQDTNPRAYFQPYNATSNPIGYANDSESTEREHALLERAVKAIASEVPTDLDIDGDNDGNVDNVVFLISGAPGAWASLLWPHMWELYTRDVLINRKKITNYNFDLTGTTTYFTVGVICHEFFHTLGGPDLYHYYDDTAPDAVGAWDVMNDTANPPQYMGAWLKYKYMSWIDGPPVISEPGQYTLNPLQSQTGNIFRINSPNSTSEFFILEYRTQAGIYEASLPGGDNGILIYRINSNYDGNAMGPPDEVYIFRPNGTTTASGILSSALFSKALGRTEFNVASNPYPFLSNGTAGKINITNIGYAGPTITFEIALNVLPPRNIISSLGYGSVELNWQIPEAVTGSTVSHYVVYRNGSLLADNVLTTTYTDGTVESGTSYQYSVSAYYTGTTSGESSKISTESILYNGPYPSPYSTGFDILNGWSQLNDNSTPRWDSTLSSLAGGIAPEMSAMMENTRPAKAMLVSPPVSTTGVDTLQISFKHFFDAFDSGLAYKIQTSRNKVEWTDTGWTFEASTEDAGPETVSVELTEFPDPVYVAWVLDGDLWNFDGWYIDDVTIAPKTPSGIESSLIPAVTKLNGNYPNPFNPETLISFDLSNNSDVKLAIYDIKGALVRTLISEKMKAGNHSVQWDGRDNAGQGLSSGVYYISLNAGEKVLTHRSLMIK